MDIASLLLKEKKEKYYLTYKHYVCENITSTLQNKDIFKSKRYFNLDKYTYDVLYHNEHTKDNRHPDDFSYTGMLGTIYIKFIAIYRIIQDDKAFFFYSKTKLKKECDTCDGKTKFSANRTIYSTSLEDLINFIWTPKQQKIFYRKIRMLDRND